jgi:MFS family permease
MDTDDDANGTRERPGRVRAVVRRFAVDLTPLRVSRDFRLLFLGLLVSQAGYQFTLIAIFIQVRDLTGSAAAVGLTGLFGLSGLVLGSLVTASFVDAHDRRLLLILAQFGNMVASAILLAGAIVGDPPLWVIYGAVALIGFLSTIDGPVRGAMTPRLVGIDLVPSALALQQVVWTATALVGPAVAGIVVARFGLAWAYGFDVVTYVAMLGAAIAIRPMAPERAGDRPTGWTAVREGFRFVRGSRLLVSTFVVDLVAMIFGLPRALFAFLAASQFDRGLEVVGLLFAAPSVGALLGAATSGWTRRVIHQGTAVLWAVVAWGAAIAAFGLIEDLWIALAFLAIAGWADVISAIFRSTILQVSVPDHLRGRMQGIHILVVTGGPRLGDVEAGLIAGWTSPATSVVSGGLACIIGAGVVAWLFPELRRYRAGTVETIAPDS